MSYPKFWLLKPNLSPSEGITILREMAAATSYYSLRSGDTLSYLREVTTTSFTFYFLQPQNEMAREGIITALVGFRLDCGGLTELLTSFDTRMCRASHKEDTMFWAWQEGMDGLLDKAYGWIGELGEIRGHFRRG